MTLLKRLAALYLILLGIAVASHFLATQLYDPTLEGSALDVWRILDPLMIIGVAISLLSALFRKLEDGNGSYTMGVTRDYLEANFAFYASGVLLILLTWNWLGFQFVDPPNDLPWLWLIIDAVVPLVVLSTGIRLMRSGD